MDRVRVSSSSIRSIGYDAAASTLEVEFTSNSIYQYFNVPESLFQRLLSAGSKGQLLDTHIKDRYRYRRIR